MNLKTFAMEKFELFEMMSFAQIGLNSRTEFCWSFRNQFWPDLTCPRGWHPVFLLKFESLLFLRHSKCQIFNFLFSLTTEFKLIEEVILTLEWLRWRRNNLEHFYFIIFIKLGIFARSGLNNANWCIKGLVKFCQGFFMKFLRNKLIKSFLKVLTWTRRMWLFPASGDIIIMFLMIGPLTASSIIWANSFWKLGNKLKRFKFLTDKTRCLLVVKCEI